jgi:Domain of unknown function (DUF4132)
MPDNPMQHLLELLRASSGRPRDEEAERVTQLSPEEQVQHVLQNIYRVADRSRHDQVASLNAVLRRKLPFTPEQVLKLVQAGEDPSYYFPFAQVVRLAGSVPMTPAMREALRRMREAKVIRNSQIADSHGVLRKIDDLLEDREAGAPFDPMGPWSRRIFPEVDRAWQELLESGKGISGSEPSKKWRDAAAASVAAIGRETVRTMALRWLALGPSPDKAGVQLEARESDYQRGLLWSLTEFSDAETCTVVARFGEQCLRKIPQLGAVSQKSGNACVGVLSAMGGAHAVAQLARLATRIRYHTARRLVEEALVAAAGRQGMSREELAEISVPTFGLDADGRRVEHLGEYTLELTSEGSLLCSAAGGKVLKSVPEALKRDFAEDLKELKDAAKEIAAMRGAHRTRIEHLLMTGRAVTPETWRSAYMDHPLMAALSRKLIWEFASGATAIWHEGRMVDWAGADVIPEGAARLWHPIRSDVQTVLAWRCRLEDRQVRQPFKQAHREVYLLTDAERATGTFSNRFAGHVLKQHQFAALCEERGWKFRLMGQWDSANTPTIELPHAGLRAEFDVEFPTDESVSGHAIYLYLATSRVRFLDAGSAMPRALESVPPEIFSEVMRDVDLFCGVTSIGADPLWGTRPDVPFREYWTAYSFGELSTAAEQRAELIGRLLPKLAIRDRCRIEGRFLWVRGGRAAYKIHMGSGHVMIEPGSRHLCIVRGPAGNSPEKVFLPFEGDTMLATILSKAFLLAADKKITDPTITRQLP